MANVWYYYDEDGVKQGPFTAAELKQHARVGAVRPNTRIETGDGRTSVASKIKGLFPEPPPILATTDDMPEPVLVRLPSFIETKNNGKIVTKSRVLLAFCIILILLGAGLSALFKTTPPQIHDWDEVGQVAVAPNDIQADFDAYWKSSPIYLVDLSWKPNNFIKENWEKRIDRWRDASKESPQAAFLLAECYWGKFGGIYVPDMLELYRFASDNGLPQAQIRRGEILMNGFGLPHKYPKEALLEFASAKRKGLGDMVNAIHLQTEQARISRQIFKGFIEEDFYYGMTEQEVEKKLFAWAFSLKAFDGGPLQKAFTGHEKPFERIVEGNHVSCRWKTLTDMFVGGMRISFVDGKANYIYPIGINANVPR